MHLSNLRPVKRIDLLLESVARIRPRDAFKLVILAGGDFSPYVEQVQRLGLGDRVVVRGAKGSMNLGDDAEIRMDA